MRGIVLAAGVAMGATAGVAVAAEGPVSMVCEGAQLTAREAEVRLTSRTDEFQTAQAALTPRARAVRVPARMMLRVENGGVSVRPETAPDRRSDDGWYALSGVVVDEARIAGVAPYREADAMKPRLVLDRRSGALRFGGFTGRCKAEPA